MSKRSFRFRQVRTMVVLLLLAGACVAGGLYMRSLPSEDAAAVPVAASAYTQADVDEALARYRSAGASSKAALVTEGDVDKPLKASLLFYGTCDGRTAEQLVASLKAGGVDASFFLAPDEVEKSGDMIARLCSAGYPVGVLADGTQEASAETLVTRLCQAGMTMQDAVGMHPSAVLTLSEPGAELQSAAAAAYFSTVYWAEEIIAPETVQSAEDAQALMDSVQRGSLLCVPLDGAAEQTEPVAWLIEALAGTNLREQAQAMLAAADPDSVAEPVTMIHTTERAVSFTFSGIGSDKELTGVLKALTDVSATAIFFVTEREIAQNETRIRQILAAGHCLGASIPAGGSLTDADVLESILRVQEALRAVYGYQGEMPIRSASGSGTGSLAVAASAGGFTLLSASVTMTLQEDAHETDAAAVLERVRPAARGVFRRGEVVHFQMNLYQSGDATLGELVRLAAKERNIYTIRSALDILHNDEYTYVYPVPEDQILPEVKDKIHPGQLTGVAFTQMAQRYIGIKWVDSTDTLPGFTKEEIKLLDKTGLVVNDSSMVFLTFDDWGTDETITALLDVLKRHKAKATFFIRTNHVTSNPNLVRAIAADGHTIGSHTNSHFPLSNVSEDGTYYTELSTSQVKALAEDLTTSYRTLQSIIGDMAVDGKASLCRIFRPPTLAVSRAGLETVLDCGFTYAISGSCTTQDYKATDRESLLKLMLKATQSGAVFVMHMSDGSIYTSSTLQSYFDYWERNPPETGAYRFCSLLDGLTN